MNNIYVEILRCVVIVSTVLIVRYLIPLIKSKIKQIQNEELKAFIEDSVRWAKQKLSDRSNEEKYNRVIEKVVDYTQRKGLDISIEVIDMLIESIYETVKKEGK